MGSRLNIRLISYNRLQFAKDAYKIVVDIDEAELRKPTIAPDLPVHADVRDVMASLSNEEALAEVGFDASCETHAAWLMWARNVNNAFPAVLPEYYMKKTPVNPMFLLTGCPWLCRRAMSWYAETEVLAL